MNKALPLCVSLLAMTASLASAAAGVSLRWDNCYGDGGAINRNFACDTNSGSSSLRGSFELGSPLTGVDVAIPIVDLATASPVLPEWWEFRFPGSCRTLALSIAAYDGVACLDWAAGMASMNIGAYGGPYIQPNVARFKIINAVPAMDAQNLAAATEYTAFALNISNTRTLGTTCTGCQIPACIVFNSLEVDTVEPGFRKLSGPANMTDSHYVTWQGGAGVTVPGRGEGCPAATPTHATTWGSVKSLYR